jgi:hypothetical protein
VHLLVDSTGLKLCGAGEWLIEKHGTKTRRAWRKLHIGLNAETGEIVAADLTTNDVDDAAQVGSFNALVLGFLPTPPDLVRPGFFEDPNGGNSAVAGASDAIGACGVRAICLAASHHR